MQGPVLQSELSQSVRPPVVITARIKLAMGMPITMKSRGLGFWVVSLGFKVRSFGLSD